MAAYGRNHKQIDAIANLVLADPSKYPENLAVQAAIWKEWYDMHRANVRNLIKYRDILRRRRELCREFPELKKRANQHKLNGALRREFPNRYDNDFHGAAHALRVDNNEMLLAALVLSALWNVFYANHEEIRDLQRFVAIVAAKGTIARRIVNVGEGELQELESKYPYFLALAPVDVSNVLAFRLGELL